MRYRHDCDKCIPLGEWNEFDLYYCEQGQEWPTVVARRSDEGSDYSSGIVFRNDIPAIGEACRRAEAKGLPLGKFAPIEPGESTW